MLTTNRLVPVLTSNAGNCLTASNWQQAGITIAAVYLDALLMKPGLAFLKSLPDLRTYYPWSGELVLNASSLNENKDGLYRVRSLYDGEILSFDASAIISLIIALKPDYVVLSDSLRDACQRCESPWPQCLPILSEQQSSYRYQTYSEEYLNDVGFSQYAGLVESNFPADDAMNGRVYDHDQMVTIADSQCSQQFEVLSAGCTCPLCSEGFTRAYFHHLFHHTPLLCQRLLIQHNVHYCQNRLLNRR